MIQEVPNIAESGVKDLLFAPISKIPQFFSLPHSTPEWPLLNSLLSTLAKGDVTDSESALKIVGKIVGIVNKTQNIKLDGIRSFLYFLQKRASNPLKYEEPEQHIHALTADEFINSLLPFIASLALQIVTLIPDGKIPHLRAGDAKQLTLGKREVAALVANIFLCTIPDREPQRHFPEACSFYYLHNFKHEPGSLFSHKYLCLANYFLRIKKEKHAASQPFIITRNVLSKEEYTISGSVEGWLGVDTPLSQVKYYEEGKIEEVAPENSIEIDFANQYIGGGALLYGCVQEEIMFVVVPELLVTCLICGRMSANEALVITGAECFSRYKGYAQTFRLASEVEEERTLPRQISAIDALMFLDPFSQSYQTHIELILREMNKAWVGFKGAKVAGEEEKSSERCIVTGKWGCGAFHGDAELKFIIQWLAASRCGRDMLFCGFHDKDLASVPDIVKKYEGSTVGALFKKVVGYSESKEKGLFAFLNKE